MTRNWITLLITVSFILTGLSIVLWGDYLASYSISAIVGGSRALKHGIFDQIGLINESISVIVDTNYNDVSSLPVVLDQDPTSQEESPLDEIIQKENSESSDTQKENSEPPDIQEDNSKGPIVAEEKSQEPTHRVGNPTLLEKAPPYVQSIMDSEDSHFTRMKCPKLSNTRYDYLHHNYKPNITTNITTNITESNPRPKYFFALDLYNAAHIMPRLFGSVVEAIKFLGPKNCELSVIEGRSDDGTFEILDLLRPEIEGMGAKYFFNTSDVDPHGEGTDRIEALSALRNMALQPLTDQPESYSLDSTIIFINDVSICLEDILEMIHQRFYQKADMTCAMDWDGTNPNLPVPDFYDTWIARTMDGDTFYDVPLWGGRHLPENIFWNNPKAKEHLESNRPFQVFACWNGAVVFTAKPILQREIKFRMHTPEECSQGEPSLFCKDLWYKGYGKIAVIPSVNLEYSDSPARNIKDIKGYASNLVKEIDDPADKIVWEENPPEMVKCLPGGNWQAQVWISWNESLPLL